MSNLKRIVSSILVLAMLATTSVFTLQVFAADETDSLTSGIALTDEDYMIAEKLNTLGIVAAVEKSALANYLTRADMIDVLMQYLGLSGNTFTAETSPFLDVSYRDPRIGAYSTLYKAGYITGDENKMYHPENLVTYNEAITMVVNVMGYKVFAVRNGGYPAGYLYTANKYGILKGLHGNGNNPIPYCDLYRLIESSLGADAVVSRYFTGDGEAEFALQKDLTVLEEIYNIKTIEGIVTGTEDTRLLSSGSELIDMHQIEIDGVIYDTPDKIYGGYIGRNVIAYAKLNDRHEYEVIYIEPVADKNNEFQVNADMILKDKTTPSRIYYEDEEGKEKHLSVDEGNLIVIYNGKAYTGYGTLKNTLPDRGYILGLDNTGDDVIDVLFVYEFTNIVVGSIDTFHYAFYDKYTNEKYTFDPVADDIRVIKANGKDGAIEDIQSDSLITITETANTKGYKLIYIYLAGDAIDGVIDEISADGKYLIGGTYYDLAYNVESYIKSGALPPLKVGIPISFTLDKEGKIGTFVQSNTTSAIYGVIAGVDAPSGGIATTLSLKIFSQDGTWIEAETVDKLNIDGERYAVATTVGMKAAVEKIPLGEVVLFKMQDGKISYIDTVEKNKGNISKAADVGNLNQIAAGTAFQQRNGMANERDQLTVNKFVVKSGQCIVFSIPARDKLLENVKKYSVSTSLAKNYYEPGGGGTYTQNMTDGYIAYNLGEEDINVATCVLLRGSETTGGGASSLGRSSEYCVVTKISSAVNKDGEQRVKLYYSSSGSESSLLLAEEINFSYTLASRAASASLLVGFEEIGLEIGDVIQLSRNAEGELDCINMVYRHNQKADKTAYLKDDTFNLSFDGGQGDGGACGTVRTVDTTNGILQYTVADSVYNMYIGDASFSIYRDEFQKVEAANIAALMPGDKVLLRTTYGFASAAAQVLVLR